ncbi:hypothetical protein HDF26_000358 [Pedobacter cryoconitis]|uniref:M12 family metallopeptidase n=1 Tax=Pedobacter cryoconitis TaxID=188932 RepID=UPI0017AFB775|nr:M12 family metallopeptidase [Pedobacter cryoconitis]MBB6269931.1 hypothetical protein [Pedobacter cryoconitis]
MKKGKLLFYLTSLLIVVNFASCKKEQKFTGSKSDKLNNDCHCNAEIALPDVKSEIITLGKGDNTIKIEKKGNVYITGGDMILSQEQVDKLRNQFTEGPKTESAVIWYKLWPDGVVYYTIDSSLPDQDRVINAMAHWSSKTPITFVPRTNQPNYVKFVNGSGCSSYIGKVGGEQIITLANGCSTGNTVHEIGHAVGLFHEQTRGDRDDYVNVFTNNIQSGYENNFQIYKVFYNGADVGDFDFNSIMLYGSYDFSKNGQPTITKKDGSVFYSQRDGLSSKDIEGVKFLYFQNPNGLPYAKVEVDNFLPYSNDSQFQESADYYIAFYSNYNYKTRVSPGPSLVINYSSYLLVTSNYGGGQQGETNYTIANPNGLNRIYLGRFPYRGSRDLEDPQWGNYIEYYTNVYTVKKGAGYNNELNSTL